MTISEENTGDWGFDYALASFDTVRTTGVRVLVWLWLRRKHTCRATQIRVRAVGVLLCLYTGGTTEIRVLLWLMRKTQVG